MPDPAPKRPSRAREMVGTRVDKSLVPRIDALAKKRNMKRGQWIRLALTRVVEAEESRGGPPNTA